MIPLRIEVRIDGPVGRPANPLHLDSLLAHLKVVRDLPERPREEDVLACIADLPLERREVGGDWVWAASTFAFDWSTPPMQRMATRSVRPHDIARHTSSGFISDFRPDTKIDVARGRLKSALYVHEVQWAKTAVAFCLGDEHEIRDLTSRLTHIGVRRRLGQGVVRSVKIIRDERAIDLWSKRNMPVGHDAGILAEGAYRLPLFAPQNRAVVRADPLAIADIAA